MRKYKAIMFDMDGTLVPMDMNDFMHSYFHELCKKLAPFGIESDKLVKAIWVGTGAMVDNNGYMKNKDVFWETFKKQIGQDVDDIMMVCDEFYGHEFHRVKDCAKENPLARKAVELAHEKAEHVVLATNPLFPMEGQKTRLSWIGLKPEDFELVTSYETDNYCKPNPSYFISVCERIGVKPQECLMIGNDENEDMYAGQNAGMDCYLVTDTMIPYKDHPWEGKRGNFNDLIEFLESLNR